MADQKTLEGIALQVFCYVERTLEFADKAKDDITKRCRLSRAQGALEAIYSFAGQMHGHKALTARIKAAWPPKPPPRSRSRFGSERYSMDDDRDWMDGDPHDFGDN